MRQKAGANFNNQARAALNAVVAKLKEGGATMDALIDAAKNAMEEGLGEDLDDDSLL
ncbi:MAG: hypothetical protein LBJ94_00855 [Puniceicoccales bacterium]|nr:hypothetical protein [Puniceicoccales bacterium]